MMTLRVGHHMPPQPLTDGQMSFHHLAQNGYTLFTDDGQSQAVRALVQAAKNAGMPLHIVSLLGEPAITEYGSDMFIVRPDQFVAWIGADEAAETVIARLAGKM